MGAIQPVGPVPLTFQTFLRLERLCSVSMSPEWASGPAVSTDPSHCFLSPSLSWLSHHGFNPDHPHLSYKVDILAY